MSHLSTSTTDSGSLGATITVDFSSGWLGGDERIDGIDKVDSVLCSTLLVLICLIERTFLLGFEEVFWKSLKQANYTNTHIFLEVIYTNSPLKIASDLEQIVREAI